MGEIKIISRSSEAFENREQAGKLLSHHLKQYKDSDAVVLGIPRGGAIIAISIAQELNIDFDIMFSHKLGAPDNPELAIGAVSENGKYFINKQIAQITGADEQYIEQEKAIQLQRIAQRAKQYREILPKINLRNRVVIITDDGIATGASMQAAAWAIKSETPQKIVLAIPVGPSDSINEIAEDADEIICLRSPPFFQALSQFYFEFEQVEDSRLLKIFSQYKNTGKEK